MRPDRLFSQRVPDTVGRGIAITCTLAENRNKAKGLEISGIFSLNEKEYRSKRPDQWLRALNVLLLEEKSCTGFVSNLITGLTDEYDPEILEEVDFVPAQSAQGLPMYSISFIFNTNDIFDISLPEACYQVQVSARQFRSNIITIQYP